MPGKASVIAERFVALALKYERWDQITELTPEEVQVLLSVVVAAGFEAAKVVPGKLVGHHLDEDRHETSETYPINSSCPYKVIGPGDYVHYRATGWLDCALRLARSEGRRDQRRCVEAIRREIERSVPLEPIQLTPEGDLLEESPPVDGYFVDHGRDGHKLLNGPVGVHGYCGGWVDRRQATKTHDAIVCRGCHMRVLFPKAIKTYGELRKTLAPKQVPVPA